MGIAYLLKRSNMPSLIINTFNKTNFCCWLNDEKGTFKQSTQVLEALYSKLCCLVGRRYCSSLFHHLYKRSALLVKIDNL